MQLDRLLREVTGSDEATSKRAQYQKLATMLNENRNSDDWPEITLKGVSKWFERGSMPGEWLMRVVLVAAIAGRQLDMAAYA